MTSIKDGVGPSLNGMVAPFRGVLILMIWFRMPTTAVVDSEDVFDFVRNLNLGIITDELTHGSPESDVIFQGISRLLRRLHGVDIRDQRVFANKNLVPR